MPRGPRRFFILPQLDKPTYLHLKDLCASLKATQFEVVSVAIRAISAQIPLDDVRTLLEHFRTTAPSEEPPA